MGIARILAENERLRQAVSEAEAAIAAGEAALAERDARIEALQASNEDLARRLELIRIKGLQRHERYVPVDEPTLPFGSMPSPPAKPPVKDDAGDDEPISKKPEPKPRGVQKRRDLSERDDLPARAVIAKVDPSSRCGRCGGELKTLGESVSWRLDWVPGHFERLEIKREKCACPKCPSEGVLIAPEPSFALPKAMCGNRLLARILVDKFADGLPLNRQTKRMAREGVEIGTQVTSAWVLGGAKLLERVVLAIEGRLMRQKWLQGDDTGFPVQDGTDGRLRKGRLWCYTDQQEVRYLFSDTKEGKVPVAFLAGFQGEALLVDLGSEFNEVVRAKGLERAGCWAHLRRYFFDARHHHPAEARAAMRLARDLFAIESGIRGSPIENIREVRERDSRPLVDAFFDFARGLQPRVRPKSELASAVRYALGHEAEFRVFLARPELPIDNNLSELQLRQPVVGRKAWLFAGSEGGAHAAATMFSLVGSCILQGTDPMEYLVDVLDRIQDHAASRVFELTPVNWRRARDGLPLLT